jgi:hypothetical protein
VILLEKPGFGADEMIAVIESLRGGYVVLHSFTFEINIGLPFFRLFTDLLDNIIIPEFKLVHSVADRKQTALAMTKLLTHSQFMQTTGQPQWYCFLSCF